MSKPGTILTESDFIKPPTIQLKLTAQQTEEIRKHIGYHNQNCIIVGYCQKFVEPGEGTGFAILADIAKPSRKERVLRAAGFLKPRKKKQH